MCELKFKLPIVKSYEMERGEQRTADNGPIFMFYLFITLNTNTYKMILEWIDWIGLRNEILSIECHNAMTTKLNKCPMSNGPYENNITA